MPVTSISNGDSGLSIRAKINTIIDDLYGTSNLITLDSGKVGIFNSSPTYYLDISADNMRIASISGPSLFMDATGGSGRLWRFLSIGSSAAGPGTGGFALYDDSAGSYQLSFYTNHDMRIHGRVLAGGSVSQARSGQIISEGHITLTGDENPASISSSGDEFKFGVYGTGGYKWIQSYGGMPIIINPLGNNVGIGASPASLFSVAGLMTIKAGQASLWARVGGILKEFYTDVNTQSLSAANIYSYSIPANVLVNNGDKIEFEATVHQTAGDSVIIDFAGQDIYNTATNSATMGASGKTVLRGAIIKTGATTARAYCSWAPDFVAFSASDLNVVDLSTITFSNSNDLRLRAATGGAPGTTGKTFIIKYFPAGN